MASARYSLRAQLAFAALAASVLLVLLSMGALVPLLERLASDQAAADARVLAETVARIVDARCEGDAACEQRMLASSLDGSAIAARLQAPAADPAQPGISSDTPTLVRGSAPLGERMLVVELPRHPIRDRVAGFVLLAASLSLLGGAAIFLLLYALLLRYVARPADRLIEATERVGSDDVPLLGEAGSGIGRLGSAFDRMALRLSEERENVQRQLSELERINRQLSETRDLILRQEKLATVGRLSAGVAHEVGNPLAALLGYLELLRATSKEAPTLDAAERMEREVKRIDRIVRDLLDFARPGQEGEPVPLSLERLVCDVLRLVSNQPRFRKVRIDSRLEEGLPAVRGDAHRLQQVLVNLLVNAADAMQGEGEIELLAREDGGRVLLAIRDRGPGIDESDLPRIFDPFFTTKAPGQGTGLGLAICHSILETLGASIAARNDPRGGAVFELELPIAVDAREAAG